MNKKEPSAIGKTWLSAIKRAWPRGTVDMPVDLDESYFNDIYLPLQRALARIKGASLLYEREPSGELEGSEEASTRFMLDRDDVESILDAAPPGPSSSYHLFFLGLTDPALRMACESERVDDDGTSEMVPGEEVFGYLVAVSMIAPVAMVQLDSYAHFEDGSILCPDLRDEWHVANDRVFEKGENAALGVPEVAARVLSELRGSISGILRSQGLKELKAELARATVPGLRAGEEAFVGKENTGHRITVQDVFFFKGP
jgi:hypothetical protein